MLLSSSQKAKLGEYKYYLSTHPGTILKEMNSKHVEAPCSGTCKPVHAVASYSTHDNEDPCIFIYTWLSKFWKYSDWELPHTPLY